MTVTRLGWIAGVGTFLAVAGFISLYYFWADGRMASHDPFALPEGARLVPHRAVYDLELGSVEDGSDIAEARGRLVIEFLEACEGYTLNQRLRTEFMSQEGQMLATDFSLSSFEARNGLSFRYALKIFGFDENVEFYTGQAQLQGPGKEGKAEFTEPADLKLDLPVGTVFPSEHTALLIKTALQGRNFVTANVFDGSGEQGLDKVSALMIQAFTPAQANAREGLQGLRSWRYHLAFFAYDNQESPPDYEVTFRLYENGISDELQMNYGSFNLTGRLVRLDIYENLPCADGRQGRKP